MEITQIQLSLAGNHSTSPQSSNSLRAYGSLVFDDCFAVHDLRIVERENGFLVAMPSQKRQKTCRKCRSKVTYNANYCGHCGICCESTIHQHESGDRLFRDVAHPITPEFRKVIEDAVISDYLTVSKDKAG